MKRRDLVRHLERNGCRRVRQGGSHTIYGNPANDLQTAVPRHREIYPRMVQKICDDLGILAPGKQSDDAIETADD